MVGAYRNSAVGESIPDLKALLSGSAFAVYEITGNRIQRTSRWLQESGYREQAAEYILRESGTENRL